MSTNPLLSLNYEPALESLGDDYYDEVAPEDFLQHTLRWRNDKLLPILGLDPQKVTDQDFIDAFGLFEGRKPFLALRYHGYQFGDYNPYLGDGRGFLYGQVRGNDNSLYDFGTKGSGRTPYSRGGDGMLTLKGGVREILAAQALHQLGVRTSRCLSVVETGLSLWRGDEPSPTRSCVMVRMSLSHIRFGTFERLEYLRRPDLIKKLLNHVIQIYYPHLQNKQDKYALFYSELVKRVAELAAQWMAAGFCHAVLNTDNMSITGESFDYGPYAFVETYDSDFTSAYFDYYGRYRYGNQAYICKENLEMLQQPLLMVMDKADLQAGLEDYEKYYIIEYRKLMMQRLGLENSSHPEVDELLNLTVRFLREYQAPYHRFFSDMAETFSSAWRDEPGLVMQESEVVPASGRFSIFDDWCILYHQILNDYHPDEMEKIGKALSFYNPKTALLKPVIESIWEPIVEEDNWEPFYQLVSKIHQRL